MGDVIEQAADAMRACAADQPVALFWPELARSDNVLFAFADALAEAGLLRSDADTRSDAEQAVIDVFDEYAAAITFTDEMGMTDPHRTSRAVDALYKLAYSRGRAARKETP